MRLMLFVMFNALWSCNRENENNIGDTLAYVPVYAQPSELTSFSVESARPTRQSGKIYVYGNYIYQNDIQSGIHIIDNSQPVQPKKVAFINLPFCTELAVKGRYLYVNNVSDLVVLDLLDPKAPTLVKRIKDAFPVMDQKHPPFSNVFFVCTDADKGIVVGWEQQRVKNPACRR
jgi:hypothetical protein